MNRTRVKKDMCLQKLRKRETGKHTGYICLKSIIESHRKRYSGSGRKSMEIQEIMETNYSDATALVTVHSHSFHYRLCCGTEQLYDRVSEAIFNNNSNGQ